MQRTPVSSSNIFSVGYNDKLSILEVEFSSGDIYQYYGVPQHLYEQFMRSGSLGTFLYKYIRSSYKYRKQ